MLIVYMLIVANKPIILSVIMLNVIMLSVITPLAEQETSHEEVVGSNPAVL